MGPRELDIAQAKALDQLTNGEYNPDSLFVLQPSYLGAAMSKIDAKRDLITMVDGLYVIAPGWKLCADRSAVGSEVSVDDVVPCADSGTRIARAAAPTVTVTGPTCGD